MYLVFLLLNVALAMAERVQFDVKEAWGVTEFGIAQAIVAAKQHFAAAPDDTVVLYFAPGTYVIKQTTFAFNLDNLQPGKSGRLIFRGSGMESTTIVTDGAFDTIHGRNVYRVTFRDMHFTRDRYTVTQGVVAETSNRRLTLDIHPGFPTPLDIFNSESDQGRYFRRYTADALLDNYKAEWPPTTNAQVAWSSANFISGRRWELELKGDLTPLADYAPGDLIGIKSKHGGQTYWLNGGDGIEFIGVKWTHQARGVLRGGISNVRFANCVVDRAPAINGTVPFLSAPGGGPQIGQPYDDPIYNVTVTNHTSVGTGDDSIGLFNVMSGSVTGCHVKDSFARGLFRCNSEGVSQSGNTFTRAPLFQSSNPSDCARVAALV